MVEARKPITILYADDDPDDRMLIKDAWAESRLANELHFVEDGEELLDYLQRRGKYADLADSAAAGHDPAGSEHAAQGWARSAAGDQGRSAPAPNPRGGPDHVQGRGRHFRAYDLGVNSFIVKPVTFQSLVDLTLTLSKYWFEVVELPAEASEAA